MLKTALIVRYWNNKQEITRNCCVNRNKPELECYGKCYVSSKLIAIDKHTKEEELPSKINFKSDVLFLTDLPGFDFGKVDVEKVFCAKTGFLYGYSPVVEVFHPPFHS